MGQVVTQPRSVEFLICPSFDPLRKGRHSLKTCFHAQESLVRLILTELTGCKMLLVVLGTCAQ